MSLPKIASERSGWRPAKSCSPRRRSSPDDATRSNIERRNLPDGRDRPRTTSSTGPDGTVRLIDLFEGRPQLIIYHFMFHPEWEDGCPSCTAGTDELSPGFLEHLHTRDTTYALVSRAPLAKLERWKAKQGWDIPWYSSFGTDFNYDFGVTIDASRGFDEYNYRTLEPSTRRWGQDILDRRAALRHARPQLLPAGRRPGLPHLLAVRPRARVHRRLVLLPRPHGPRPAGGLGGAQGPQRVGAGQHDPTSRHDDLVADGCLVPRVPDDPDGGADGEGRDAADDACGGEGESEHGAADDARCCEWSGPAPLVRRQRPRRRVGDP